MRDLELEAMLISALEGGGMVWVVGDIHGYFETFEALIEKLELSENDHLLCVGDLIDRGPRSQDVLDLVRGHPRIHSARGNHEEAMRIALSPRHNGKMMKSWLKYGGIQTLESFSEEPDEAKDIARGYLPFIESLPTLVVLNKHIVVHAGFDISKPMSSQNDRDMMWNRSIFNSNVAIDPSRQIVVGHTTIQDLVEGPTSITSVDIWRSDVPLSDGVTPCVVGIDTGIYMHESFRPRLTAYEISSESVISQPRIEN